VMVVIMGHGGRLARGIAHRNIAAP
jgi:hypothetical protein